MGFIRRERKELQESAEPSLNVWIEDPNGTGQLMLVKKSDLDDEGHLIVDEDEVKEDGI